MPFAAFQAGCIGRVAVKFDNLLGRNSGPLMQSINILGDDCRNFAVPHQFLNRPVPPVGLGTANSGVRIEFSPPGFPAHFLR